MSSSDILSFEALRKFRKTERAQMIEAVRDLIEEARRRAKSNYTRSKERARWTRLAGQLIWYKDQILRSMSYEALEEEVAQLKEMVLKKADNLASTRRTIRDASGSIVLRRPRSLGPVPRRTSKNKA